MVSALKVIGIILFVMGLWNLFKDLMHQQSEYYISDINNYDQWINTDNLLDHKEKNVSIN